MVRVKRRYIAIHVNYKGTQESYIKEIKSFVGQIYGDFGVACFNRGYSVKRYEKSDGYMILQVRKGVHDMVMSVIPLMPHRATIVHLSGTIRGCLKQIKKIYIMNLRASIAETMKKQANHPTIHSLDL